VHSPPVPSDETFQDVDVQREARAARRAPQLFLVLECERPSCGSARHTLEGIDEVVIGRRATRSVERVLVGNTGRLILGVPDRRMSAQHARLVRGPSGFVFEDLGSTNGSRLYGEKVDSVALHDGAVLELARTFFVFREEVDVFAGTVADLDSEDLRDVPVAFRTVLPGLHAAFTTLSRIARSRVPVLLLGETGTGKEVLAAAIHELSGRPGVLVPVNCGALPATLVESQLFGHVRGAFSGATRDEPGYVRSADGGTLLLDEIGDLPAPSQAALLRVLQESEVVAVGTTRAVPVDVRVIAATHAPIVELTQSGEFRDDLFARLAGYTFHVPPLRERMQDLGVLIAGLLPGIAASGAPVEEITPEAVRALLRHSFRRNVRELRQCLEAAAVMAGGGPIDAGHVTPGLLTAAASSPEAIASAPAGRGRAPDEQLRDELVLRFKESKGNVSLVARRMGRARVQIQRWMKRFDIDPSKFK
jgi:transcriptional regulator of acetoin/glycerol metabolism